MPHDQKPMQWTRDGFLPFRLEVLTPVFIGTGETVSPLDYVLGVRDDHRMYRIDLDRWIADGARPDQIDVLGSGDLRRIQRMLQDDVDPARYATSKAGIRASLRDDLLAGLRDQRSNRTNDVDAAVRNPLTGAPYIPGSSIKGAIGTPLIDHADRKKAGQRLRDACGEQDRDSYRHWMDDVFGKIGEHAMKALKVSDCPVPDDAVLVVSANERSLNSDRRGTPKNPAEALRPGTECYGRLAMATQGGRPRIVLPGLSGTDASIGPTELRTLCNEFYRDRYRQEARKFYALAHFRETAEALREVDARMALLDGPNPPILLRVGRYSHVECVTVTDNAPARRRGKNGLLPTGTTRTLADGVLPFGWVLLHPCDEEELESHVRTVELERTMAWERRVLVNMESARKTLAQEQLRREERQREEDRRREERQREEEKAARLAEMPEDRRIVARLRDGDMSENETMDVYAGLDGWPEDIRRSIAEALRDDWTRRGKWTGKQSKKQVEKIGRIKSIIG